MKEDKAKGYMKAGGIRSWMMIEVLAVTESAARQALENHLKNMEREKGIIIVKKEFRKPVEVSNPLQNIEKGYSHIVELEAVAKNYETLINIVMNYAPSSIEILEPEKLEMDIGEAQGILNSIADMMHKFARAGIGGVIVKAE
ncbi:MAG: hypothetical protein HYX24_00740 [Candidatus Aenigmarchaeota archaeon]|nr:hypothetical protein [Candidatus Aenigmarchaeota archaeon]